MTMSHLRPVKNTLHLHQIPKRHRVTHCRVCRQATHEGKPFCSDHVDRMPYAQEIRRQLAAGVLEEDLLVHIHDRKAVTAARLGRLVDCPQHEVETALRKLQKRKQVRLGFTRRGGMFAELIKG